MITVYRYRVKSNERTLERWARACNLVWNYCNDRQKDAVRFGRKWLTGFDLNNLTAGSSKELGLHSSSINAVCERYAKSRAQHKRPWLRYRGRKSLGWVPTKGRDIKYGGDGKFKFFGVDFRVAYSREIPAGAKIKDGSCFAQDSLGHWYLSVVLELQANTIPSTGRKIGIDLGLKDFASMSDGGKVEAPRIYRKLEARLASAQRAGKIKQARRIHKKIANQRSDFLHKLSRKIVNENDVIAVGNVNASGLSKTALSKSVLDAGWSSFREMLRYKSEHAGRIYKEVNEAYSSQVCSSCGALPDSRPSGIADLGVRQWTCCECGAKHDRDTNAAKNILARAGHRTPVEGEPVSGLDAKSLLLDG